MFVDVAISKLATKLATNAGKPINRHEMAVKIHHNECIVLYFSQIVLYSTLVGVEVAGPAQWWLTLFQLIPATALFFLMRLALKLNPGQNLMGAFQKSLGTIGSALAISIYGLLLLTDAWFTLHALCDIVAAYVVKQPVYRLIGIAAILVCLAAVLVGGTDGSSRMVYLWRWPFSIILVIAIMASLQMGSFANLFPFMGPGIKAVGASFINGSGAAWPVILMGFVPEEPNAPMPWRSQKPAGYKWLLFAILSVTMPMFCYSFVQPYDILMAPSTWGSRIVGFLRSNPLKWVWEVFLIRAMFTYICTLCSSISIFSYLTTQGVIKKAKRAVMAIFFGAVLTVLAYFHQDSLTGLFGKIMPWRFVAAVIPLLAAILFSFINNHRRIKKVSA